MVYEDYDYIYCKGTNFRALKIHTQAHKLFWAHKNISDILLKYSPCYWAPTNISYIKPHKLPWTLSQKLPIISHMLSNLDFPQIILITLLPNLGHKITLSPQKAQNHLTCGQSPTKPPYKSSHDMASLKPAMMWHL